MSEHADYLTDAMLEGKAAHEAGHCEYGCQWCDGEDTGPTPEPPPPAFVATAMSLCGQVTGCVATIYSHTVGDEEAEEIIRQVVASSKAVFGERDTGDGATWDELRRGMAGALRICLEHLEK